MCGKDLLIIFKTFSTSGEVTLSITEGCSIFYFNGTSWVTTQSIWVTENSLEIFDEPIPIGLNPSNVSVSIAYNDNNDWAWGFGFDNFWLCGLDAPPQTTISTMGEWALFRLVLYL